MHVEFTSDTASALSLSPLGKRSRSGESSVPLDQLQLLGSGSPATAQQQQQCSADAGGAVAVEESPSKKGRVSVDGPVTVIPGGIRVNDITSLRFIRTKSIEGSEELADVFGTCQPTYTHQLFNDEKVYLKGESTPEVRIDINLHDLGHDLKIQGAGTQEDVDQLTSGLDPIIPKEPVSIEVGEVVRTFDQDGYVFEIRRATHRDAGATKLLRSCERLAMWFIETADAVDFEDDRWEALFLLGSRKSTESQQSSKKELVGYFTIYTFINPIAGSKARICQALLLPPYQGRGLGRELMRQVYFICKKRDEVVEITVEDPAPAFEALRDAVDVEWTLEHASLVGIPYDAGAKTLTKEVFSEMDKATVKMAPLLKITKSQAEFVRDALQYLYISIKKSMESESSDAGGDSAADANVPTMKQWRLDFKRKLVRKLPELKNLPKEEMQKELEALYLEFVDRAKPLKSNKRLKQMICHID